MFHEYCGAACANELAVMMSKKGKYLINLIFISYLGDSNVLYILLTPAIPCWLT
jgi:hypothetical protein